MQWQGLEMRNHNINKSPTWCCNIQAEVFYWNGIQALVLSTKIPSMREQNSKPSLRVGLILCPKKECEAKRSKWTQYWTGNSYRTIEFKFRKKSVVPRRPIATQESPHWIARGTFLFASHLVICPGTIQVNSQARILLREADKHTQHDQSC